MQTSGSQTGISVARLRFSYWAVPVGKVPSLGNALTGHAIAASGHDFAEDIAHEFGRVFEVTIGRLDATRVVWNLDFVQMRERLIDGAQIHLHDFLAFLPVGFANRIFDRIDRLLRRQARRRWQRSRSASRC